MEEGREHDILTARDAAGGARRVPSQALGVRLHRRPRALRRSGVRRGPSELTTASELLATFGDLPGLAKLLERLGVREESPGVAASALEFALEGLHLSRRLNKDEEAGVARYAGPDAS